MLNIPTQDLNLRDQRKLLTLVSCPSESRTERKGWYTNLNNCPAWWKSSSVNGQPIPWQSPNHPKSAFLSVQQQRTLIDSYKNWTKDDSEVNI